MDDVARSLFKCLIILLLSDSLVDVLSNVELNVVRVDADLCAVCKNFDEYLITFMLPLRGGS